MEWPKIVKQLIWRWTGKYSNDHQLKSDLELLKWLHNLWEKLWEWSWSGSSHLLVAGGGRGEGGGPADGVEREQLGLVGQREVFEHARPQDEVGRRSDEVPLRQEAAIWIKVKIELSLKMLNSDLPIRGELNLRPSQMISPEEKTYHGFKGENWTSQSFLRQPTTKRVQVLQAMWICGLRSRSPWNTLRESVRSKVDEIEAFYWSRAQIKSSKLVKSSKLGRLVGRDLRAKWMWIPSACESPQGVGDLILNFSSRDS